MGFSNKTSYPTTPGSSWTISPTGHARYKLSGANSYNGPIDIPSGSANKVTLHTCSEVALDELYIYCNNYHTASINLFLGVGSDSDAATIKVAVSAGTGLVQVYPGTPHNNSMEMYAWSDRELVSGESNGIHVTGFVMRHYLIDPNDESFGYDGTEG
jgi:hypothetical protein